MALFVFMSIAGAIARIRVWTVSRNENELLRWVPVIREFVKHLALCGRQIVTSKLSNPPKTIHPIARSQIYSRGQRSSQYTWMQAEALVADSTERHHSAP